MIMPKLCNINHVIGMLNVFHANMTTFMQNSQSAKIEPSLWPT